LEAELLDDQSEDRRDEKRDDQLGRVSAIARITPAQDEIQEATPVNNGDGENRARLNDDVEHVRPVAEPLLSDDKVAGARNRQKLGNSLYYA